ncbi:MAG TPA: 4-hydroxythreonine-4-phosphate dehydrogenase PdxA [Xanthobacteraceae bacterium]|nr:4-hydroxythreonine-4-phosphate dehydrogenase PdxA [Xanthobacteraceae bacterium]
MNHNKPRIAVAVGDPAGIGPEIALKAARDAEVRAVCRPILVGDVRILERQAKSCGLKVALHAVKNTGEADWSGTQINVLDCPVDEAETLAFGAVSAAAGRASIAFCRAAVKAALAGEVDAVAAAPQNETSVAMAGIKFDGHPSFVARETGTPEDEVFMMLCFGGTRIAHATLHRSVRDAIAEITPQRIGRVLRTTDRALRRLGIGQPNICVSGLNPHAGEGGLFGREEIEIIGPAIAQAQAESISVTGPVGADIMFQSKGFDAFVVMLHDQGHIAAKVLAPHAVVALTIGAPILFASVAHGTAHDIAGRGIASPAALIEAIRQFSGALRA